MAGARDRIDATFDAVCRAERPRLGADARRAIFSERRSIWSPPWTAVLFRAEVFERVGLLNETFESYLEDVEFGMRCAFRGVSGLYVPEAVAWHRGSATWGRWHPETVRRISRNQCYLVALHYPLRHAWEILWRGFFGSRGGSPWGRNGMAQGKVGASGRRAFDEPQRPDETC
jgi:GT2 family glycosyltransferase